MKILVAMDSFKGSLSSLDAGYAVQDGILKADPEAQFTVKPLADGGEGTVSALTEGLGGRIVRVSVTNPVGKQTEAEYGILLIAFSGCVSPQANICNSRGIDAYFPILQSPVTLSEAMDPGNASQNLSRTAEQVFRLIHAICKKGNGNAISKQM